MMKADELYDRQLSKAMQIYSIKPKIDLYSVYRFFEVWKRFRADLKDFKRREYSFRDTYINYHTRKETRGSDGGYLLFGKFLNLFGYSWILTDGDIASKNVANATARGLDSNWCQSFYFKYGSFGLYTLTISWVPNFYDFLKDVSPKDYEKYGIIGCGANNPYTR